MIHYRILSEHNLIAICNWGETSVEEIKKFSRNLQSDPQFSQKYDAIVDTTQLKRPYTRDEIYELSEPRIDITISVGRIAVIAPADIMFGMSRMHGIISETKSPHTINVFRDMDSALKWLERKGLDIESVFEEIRKRSALAP